MFNVGPIRLLTLARYSGPINKELPSTKAWRILSSNKECPSTQHRHHARQITMEKSIEAPQQHKQPSRKGKKAWRKNVDVSDVQAGLEQARDEVIKGSVPPIRST